MSAQGLFEEGAGLGAPAVGATLAAELEAAEPPVAAAAAEAELETWPAATGELEHGSEASPELAATAEGESIFDEAAEALRRALDAARTRARIASGIHDETQLTNLVFFDRHADRAGRALSPSEPTYEELHWEWLAIRDTIVRPALRPTAVKASGYDRDGAIAYARKFWLRPCDDGFIALGPRSGRTFAAVPAGTRFEHEPGPPAAEHAVLPDGSQIPWAHLDDCTHFISCCLGARPGERSGGIDIAYRQLGAPPAAPYGIVRVSTMVSYLVRQGLARVVAEKSADDRMIDSLAPGDLVAYFNLRLGLYSHLALLLPDHRIACHTYGRSDDPGCRWDNHWDLGRDTHRWTFLHMA